DNKLTYLAPHEFRHLSKLLFLHLDGNKLTTLKDQTFDGQALKYLGLSRNSISAVETCAFCNSSISELNLSRNSLMSSRDDPLRALSLSLERLDLSYNPTLRGVMVAVLIRHLHKLTVLNLEGIGLYDLPATTFSSVTGLRQLYLNNNSFNEFRYSLFLELKKLEVLNISHNNLRFLRSSVIRSLNDTNTRIIMHDNPWQCQTCYMSHLLSFLSQRPIGDNVKRPVCADPPNVRGLDLYRVQLHKLEECSNPILEPRISGTESQVGLIVAIIIIMVIVTIIIATIVIYRTQGAVYYTHEGDGSRGSLSYDNFGCKDSLDSKRPSIVATIDDTISRSS
ncbi:leucine-rich repeat-containing protein 15-like, partial [Tropilaelaps mercedesae]